MQGAPHLLAYRWSMYSLIEWSPYVTFPLSTQRAILSTRVFSKCRGTLNVFCKTIQAREILTWSDGSCPDSLEAGNSLRSKPFLNFVISLALLCTAIFCMKVDARVSVWLLSFRSIGNTLCAVFILLQTYDNHLHCRCKRAAIAGSLGSLVFLSRQYASKYGSSPLQSKESSCSSFSGHTSQNTYPFVGMYDNVSVLATLSYKCYK